MLRIRALAERIRSSLFYVPALYVVAAAGLAWLLITTDRTRADLLDDIPLLLPVTVGSARALLGAIAGATITVAGIVFSVTVVSVQLASSQFSPRVLRGFLRDRFQQNVIGLVVGTFTYCMFVLATIRLSGSADDETAAPSLAVSAAILLAVFAILGIIAFIDHSARSMQVGRIIRRVTRETHHLINELYPDRVGEGPSPPVHDRPMPTSRSVAVRARTQGWVQQIDIDRILAAMPPGAYVRLDVRVGGFVNQGLRLCTLWPTDSDEEPDAENLADRVNEAFAIGGERTMQQDVAFGLRQLVDIALRALSPGVNDPTTAQEAIVHISAVVNHLLHRDLPPRIRVDEQDRVLVAPEILGYADYVAHAFDQIRLAAAAQPAVLITLLQAIGQPVALLREAELEARAAPLLHQAELVLRAADGAGLLPHDCDRVRETAERLHLVEPEEAPEDEAVGAG